ncbi:hypothetical protein CEXT_42691 [Caerostris extrusa]|uniref:Uncharacterized protein n=1 Tax=Caerostris extrusa TaxID=172846 RepID=A0AAV4R145_CAEEX|nr:hypothetical protein CEXT_42691 [Caerostris extrusa]
MLDVLLDFKVSCPILGVLLDFKVSCPYLVLSRFQGVMLCTPLIDFKFLYPCAGSYANTSPEVRMLARDALVVVNCRSGLDVDLKRSRRIQHYSGMYHDRKFLYFHLACLCRLTKEYCSRVVISHAFELCSTPVSLEVVKEEF